MSGQLSVSDQISELWTWDTLHYISGQYYKVI